MTTELSVHYEKSTVREDPKIQVGLHVPALTYLKLFFYALLSRPQAVQHVLTAQEIENLAKLIVRWRIVCKIRGAKKVGAEK